MTSAYIIGAGQTACGRFADATVASLAIEALDAALEDAAVAGPERVEAIFHLGANSSTTGWLPALRNSPTSAR